LKTISLTHHRARQLRHNLTDTEKKLWARLRSSRFSNLRFRRQFPIGNFIADFACPKARLVVELDGAQHLDRTARDSWRTKLLGQHG
jgi:very-short-patch-repair endonuclease